MSFPQKPLINGIIIGMKIRKPGLFKKGKSVMFQKDGKPIIIKHLKNIMAKIIKYASKNNIKLKTQEECYQVIEKVYPIIGAKIIGEKALQWKGKKHDNLVTGFADLIKKEKIKTKMGPKKIAELTNIMYKIAAVFGSVFADIFDLKKIKKINIGLINVVNKMLTK